MSRSLRSCKIRRRVLLPVRGSLATETQWTYSGGAEEGMKTGWGGDIYKRTERSRTSIAGRATERASAMVRDRSTYSASINLI